MPEIQLPVFRGPLDLLLHLIERDDLDITAVSLVAVADQYLKAIHNGEGFNPQALAEFVAIGAKLIYLKSSALLPRAPAELAAEVEEDDVGSELVELLMEYKRFTEATDLLVERQEAGVRVYPRMAPPPPREPGAGLDGVTVDAMRKIMLDVLSRTLTAPRIVIPRDNLTLSGRLADFRERLQKRGRFSFRAAVMECRTRVEVVISFLAVLELLKSGDCEARQTATWGDIEVVLAVAGVAAGR